ncbi:MAG: hypothetical protein LBI87_13230 [Candidatus Accumulibacter sp.]|jgi:hypothetical protein|nr:hypothetical protein [Accumulibacter sp.]
MNARRRAGFQRPGESRGAALLMLLLAVVLAFGALLVTSLAGNDHEIARRQRTIEALARAKQALVAWAVMQGDIGADSYRRPGTLPCPDTNFFGSASSGNASGSCSSAGGTSLGRLPWKSLGVEALRDAHGELLWYAVSDNFRRPNDLNNKAINSDTKGSLLLYAPDGDALLTPPGEELAAVILAPGPPLPGQDRGALSNAASSYLEAFKGKNNASAAGPFVMGPVRDPNGNPAVNDLVVGIGARELIAAIELRALKEAQNALKRHVAETGSLPNPAPGDAPGCLSPVTNVKSVVPCASAAATCSGRLPEDALTPYVAPWFSQNGWGRVMIYAIDDAGVGCATSLNVEGKPKNHVLITTGVARKGQTRPSARLSDYLENPGYADGWPGDSGFFVPGTDSNDQLRSDP